MLEMLEMLEMLGTGEERSHETAWKEKRISHPYGNSNSLAKQIAIVAAEQMPCFRLACRCVQKSPIDVGFARGQHISSMPEEKYDTYTRLIHHRRVNSPMNALDPVHPKPAAKVNAIRQ
jgi:hypothetical protein